MEFITSADNVLRLLGRNIKDKAQMGISKFHQSCGGYGTAQNQFEHTNKDCHLFSTEILKVLKKYCEIPENQFSIYSIDEGNGFQLVRPALMNAIEVKLDNYWHFGVG